MKVAAVLLLLACCSTVTLVCSKNCRAKRNGTSVFNGLNQTCSGGSTKIMLEIDIAGCCKGKKCKKNIISSQTDSETSDNVGTTGNLEGDGSDLEQQ